jgi:hypothetical protein
VEQGEAVNTVTALKGLPVFIPRMQSVDRRSRHRGVSHHTVTNLARVAVAPAEVPLPEPLDSDVQLQMRKISRRHCPVVVPISPRETEAILATYPYGLTSMGRRVAEDPLFFRTICAGAIHAWRRWREWIEEEPTFHNGKNTNETRSSW